MDAPQCSLSVSPWGTPSQGWLSIEEVVVQGGGGGSVSKGAAQGTGPKELSCARLRPKIAFNVVALETSS